MRSFLVFCGVVAAFSLGGCDTPSTRARTHADAYGKLSASDRRIVLAGRVHTGMSSEAVYIAWGEPDRKQTSCGGKEQVETWFYRRQLVLRGPFDSFDRWLPGNGVLGPTVPAVVRAGFGFGGIGNGGALLTQPHLLIADDTVKQADFTAGRLTAYDLYRAGTLPLR